jgi:hypothetical protein
MQFTPLRPRDNEIMQLVLRTIDLFRDRFGDSVPIALTDTQSAFDTATLAVDSCNLLLACCDRPEEAIAYLRRINAAIVEFSQMQAERCGKALTRPGHIMPSTPEWQGISVSDDNIMFCSPQMNRRVTAVVNAELGREFGGIAVHSCGKWAHSMPVVRDMAGCLMVDCSVGPAELQDCNPPEAVRDVFRGSDVIVHARLWGDNEKAAELASRLAVPGLRLVASVWCRPDPDQRAAVYDLLDAALASAYD